MEAGRDVPTMLLHVFIGQQERAGSEVAVGAMSSELWGRLPTELVDLVLPHLPLKSKHKCRCVSKHWKRMLTPYALPDLCGVSFVWPSDNGGGIWDEEYVEAKKKVQPSAIRVDLSFLPPKFHWWLPTACATDGGFVVVSNMTGNGRPSGTSFCVFNPMTRSWREIPALPVRNLNRLVRVSVKVTHYGGVDEIDVVVVCTCTMTGKFVPLLAEYSTETTNLREWEVCFGIGDTPMWATGVGSGEALVLEEDEVEGKSVLVCHLDYTDRYGMQDPIPLPQEVLVRNEILLTYHGNNAYLVVDVPTRNYKTASIWKMSTLREIWQRLRSHNDMANSWQQVSMIPRELLSGNRVSLDEVKVAGSYICVISDDRLSAYSVPGKKWAVISREAAGFSHCQDFLVPDMETVM